jgi:hypothetical protein
MTLGFSHRRDPFKIMNLLLRELLPSFKWSSRSCLICREVQQFAADAKRSDSALLSLSDRDVDSALCQSRGVIGMTSMVLLEAALLGVPVLSLQCERKESNNPTLDQIPGIAVVTESSALPVALGRFLSTLGNAPGASPLDVVTRAAEQFVAAIERELIRTRRRTDADAEVSTS